MKILLLSNKVPYPAHDGSSIAIASMVDALLKNGAEVSLLSLNTAKHFKEEKDILEALPRKLRFYQVYLDNRITTAGAFFNLLGNSAFHVSRFHHKGFSRLLAEILEEEDFDVIQLEGLAMAVYLKEIRKLTSTKVVLRAHNMEGRIWQRHIENEKKWLRRKYLEIQVSRLSDFEIRMVKEVDALVTISEEDLRNFRIVVKSKVSISIPCGVDLKDYPRCSGNSETVDIAYLASFDWLPNRQGAWWFVNEVWPLVQQQCPEATFRLGGRHMSANLKSLEMPRIEVMEEVPDMRAFICSARLVVVPLLAGSGMRIKVLENMALGKCQVSTSIGAEGIEVSHGGDIILADTPQRMALGIVALLKNPAQRKTLGDQARLTVEKYYSNARLGEQLVEFYETEVCW